ncbi:hypothetical protein ACEQ8H_004122 [Pleosporales sp. CAS-2024a]
MAPVEPEAAARNNVFAYMPFGTHMALVLGLTAHVVLVARRAAKALPPATATRTQEPLRRRYAVIFSLIAALSLASVTTFAVIWRAISYKEWVHTETGSTPNVLYNGAHGTAGGRWYLGDWIHDVDLQAESDAIAVRTPEGFLYTSQHFTGLLAASMFFGVQGHRRNLHASTVASFVLLGATGSLGYALSLFFITILYTPLTIHQDDTLLHHARFTPSPVVYYLPITASLLFMYCLPTAFREHDFLARTLSANTISTLRWGKVAVPMLLAFAPEVLPASLGRQHVSKTAAHRSYTRVFQFLSTGSIVLYWVLVVADVTHNTPQMRHSRLDVFKNSVGLSKDGSLTNRILSGISATAQRLKIVSKDPIIGATSADVLFTVISLLTWTFSRDLDVEAMLENSVLAFLVPHHPEKHVAFQEGAKLATQLLQPQSKPDPLLDTETTTPRKRGRPAKNKPPVPSRRSARSHAESTFHPNPSTQKQVAEMHTDGPLTAAADLVHSQESTALALFLVFVGGLGQLAASALGADVTGPREE